MNGFLNNDCQKKHKNTAFTLDGPLNNPNKTVLLNQQRGEACKAANPQNNKFQERTRDGSTPGPETRNEKLSCEEGRHSVLSVRPAQVFGNSSLRKLKFWFEQANWKDQRKKGIYHQSLSS